MRGATGHTVRRHQTYELSTPDGLRLRTLISRPVDATTYGEALWSHILRDQLHISADEFWACVTHGVFPVRGAAVGGDAAKTLPASLVFALIRQASDVAPLRRRWTIRSSRGA